jgi:hypothetical protein
MAIAARAVSFNLYLPARALPVRPAQAHGLIVGCHYKTTAGTHAKFRFLVIYCDFLVKSPADPPDRPQT